MTDDTRDWRAAPPEGLWAGIYAARCGWHVVLHQTGRGISGALNPSKLGISCIPYKAAGFPETGYSQGMAMAIGLINIVDGVPEECNNL